MKLLIVALSLLLLGQAFALELDPRVDYRIGSSVLRDSRGSIVRSSAVINAFKKIHRCPSTGNYSGACPGWAIDHVIPLYCGGKDVVYNMQWLPSDMKSSNNPHAKDRFERKIYCPLFQITP